MMKRQVVSLLLAALLPLTASAHPGHGHSDPDGPAHYLLSWEHSAPILAACLIAAAIAAGARMALARSHAS